MPLMVFVWNTNLREFRRDSYEVATFRSFCHTLLFYLEVVKGVRRGNYVESKIGVQQGKCEKNKVTAG